MQHKQQSVYNWKINLYYHSLKEINKMELFRTEIFLIIDRSKNNLKKKSIKHIYNVLWILKVTPEGFKPPTLRAEI
tara:strand:- start:242 stop:469 length:228 start_codon:yes stop_codon:yes gene_type:complete